MSTLVTVAVVAAIIGSALIGGIFFAFSNFIMKALAQVPSPQGVSAMQSINVTVLNRWFLGAFMGTAVVCLFLAVIAIADWRMAPSPYLLGGAVAYVAGTWLVTVGGNVPLNHRLAELAPDDPASSDLWDHYLDRWTTLNSRRAGSAVCAAVLFCIGLIVAG